MVSRVQVFYFWRLAVFLLLLLIYFYVLLFIMLHNVDHTLEAWGGIQQLESLIIVREY